MNRDAILALANEAARDPSRAARLASLIADELAAEDGGGPLSRAPAAYFYAPAHQWLIQAQGLVVEPLPTDQNPQAMPITQTANVAIPLRVPFDAILLGGAAWSQPTAQPVQNATTVSLGDVTNANGLSNSIDGRDLFSLQIGIDGQTWFSSDGRDPMLFPASTIMGSRLRPRAMAWTVRRNSIIQAKFRNVCNVPLDGVPTTAITPPVLSCAVAFYALNLEAP
jgi:hypothetical protein